MSFDWQKYLSLAKELSGKPVQGEESREAKLRSAISRAYYAVFHIAKDHASSSPNPPDASTEATHKNVREWFKASPDKRVKRIGEDLGRLRVNRNRADYNDDMGLLRELQKTTDEALKTAEYIITNIHSLSNKR
ncbi:MAG: hypothetical protein HC893_00340 [Chloroflexaceae bacterium]|nr:hypothetical protein [Chloroflexaceae bacterium]